MAKYLDKTGLKTYDSLIKKHVDSKIKEVDDTAVKDVLVNGTSVVDGNRVAKIPESAMQTLGVVDLDKFKLTEGKDGKLVIRYGESLELDSSITYSDLVKDGILESVDLITVPTGNPKDTEDNENAPGTYLKFVFNEKANKKAIYVNVTSLIDEYAWETNKEFKGEGKYINIGAGVRGTGKKTDAYKLVLTVDESELNNKLNELVLKPATSSGLGGIEIGYTENGKNYPLELDGNKAYVNVPWTDTDTKVTSEANHYTPATDDNSILDASKDPTGSSTFGTTAFITGIKRDSKGHITGITSSKLPANPNTDTHWTSRLYAGTGGATHANVASSADSKLALYENGILRDTITISGNGIDVSISDANNTNKTSTINFTIEVISENDIKELF